MSFSVIHARLSVHQVNWHRNEEMCHFSTSSASTLWAAWLKGWFSSQTTAPTLKGHSLRPRLCLLCHLWWLFCKLLHTHFCLCWSAHCETTDSDNWILHLFDKGVLAKEGERTSKGMHLVASWIAVLKANIDEYPKFPSDTTVYFYFNTSTYFGPLWNNHQAVK